MAAAVSERRSKTCLIRKFQEIERNSPKNNSGGGGAAWVSLVAPRQPVCPGRVEMTSTPPRMSSSAHPLSPSRAGNFPSPLDASTEPGPPARPPRKRLVLEPDQDFFDAALLAEAEMEGQEEPEDDQYAPPEDDAPNKDVGKDAPGHDSDVEMAEEEVFVRRGVREGKKRLVLVPDEDFAAEPETRDEDVGMGGPSSSFRPWEGEADVVVFGRGTGATAATGLRRTRSVVRQYEQPQPRLRRGSSDRSDFVRWPQDHVQAEKASRRPHGLGRAEGKSRWSLRATDSQTNAGRQLSQKEMSDSLAHLSKSMLETPYLQMINDIASAKKQADVDACVSSLWLVRSQRLTRCFLERTLLSTSTWLRSRLLFGLIDTGPRSSPSCLATRYEPVSPSLVRTATPDLCICQRVHRAALLWLKEWDTCVFPGTSKTTAAAELKRERRKKRARDGKQFGVVQEVEVEEVRAPPFSPNSISS